MKTGTALVQDFHTLFYPGAQSGVVGSSGEEKDITENPFTPGSEAANTFPNRNYQVIHLGTNNFQCKMVSHQLKLRRKRACVFQDGNKLLMYRFLKRHLWP